MNLDHVHAEALAEKSMREHGMSAEEASRYSMALWLPTNLRDMEEDWRRAQRDCTKTACAALGIPLPGGTR